MMGVQSSKHLVAKSWFPHEPKRLTGEAAQSPTQYTIRFRCALDGSGGRTASLRRVCLRSKSDTPQ